MTIVSFLLLALTLVPKLFLGVFALVLAVFFLLLVILDFLQQPQLPFLWVLVLLVK